MDWAEESNCLSDVQFGFRQGRRTCDPIFIINSAIQYYKKKSIPIYACFVDFQKAFDSVNHAHLWTKLASLGVSKQHNDHSATKHVRKGCVSGSSE